MTAPKGNGLEAANNQPAKFTKYVTEFIAFCNRIATDGLTLYLACVLVSIGAAVVVLWGVQQ